MAARIAPGAPQFAGAQPGSTGLAPWLHQSQPMQGQMNMAGLLRDPATGGGMPGMPSVQGMQGATGAQGAQGAAGALGVPGAPWYQQQMQADQAAGQLAMQQKQAQLLQQQQQQQQQAPKEPTLEELIRAAEARDMAIPTREGD
jgi:hypothetical protein